MLPVPITFGSEQEWIDASVSWLEEAILDVLSSSSHCTVALSGGSTPKKFYASFSEKVPAFDRVVWTLADERYISSSDERSNQRLVQETLLKGQHPSRFIVPDTSLELQDCLSSFEADVRKSGVDIAVLGMGGDGHTASLFPPVSAEAFSEDSVVLHTTTDAFDVHDRISLSGSVLRNAKCLVLLKGEDKKQVWEEMVGSSEGAERWPLRGVLKSDSKVMMM